MIQPWKLRQATRVILGGGIIAYPTEAVYGLGCDPLDGAAVQRLLLLKGRQLHKGLILIAADFAQLRPFVAPLDRQMMQPVLQSWPGPNTWIVPAAEHLPHWLTGGRETLAVRVTNHPIAAALCRNSQMPLVSTSANPSGFRPARSALSVRRIFPSGIDLIVHGPLGALDRPTRIRDARSGATIRG
ncbi:MAG: L-threonylcarbamoyladenylate synthase [Gammaproteobacteria bacterium]|nr:L-threonylcarbamoyladenylate synthase [Gammaproteobacteria bacterium]MCP5417124.1 L-threonylcarbamoyladenylate synthase [Chromatiaceae bacterium]